MIKSGSLGPKAALKLILEATRYREKFAEQEGASVDDPRLAMLDELLIIAGHFVSTVRFLNYVDRVEQAVLEARRSRAGGDALTLATIHACKGREWRNVWIADTSKGRSPHTFGDPDEEKRIFYVGVTRAKDRCVVSSGDSPSPYLRLVKAMTQIEADPA